MNPDKMGNFIKQIRKENNLTQKELADRLGVTYQAVSKWENGKNAPDIATLKKISDEFHVNIDEILEGEKQPKKKKSFNQWLLEALPILVIAITLVIINYINQPKQVEITTISSKCSDFKITGVAAYDKAKTAISITKVEFCGEADDQVYKMITCRLYEKEDKTSKEINSCKVGKETTLEDYLKEVNIQVDNYSTMCKQLTSNSLFLEIYATDQDNKITTFTIPIQLNDKCK